ncbi:hypothetical protein ABW19_dt0200639 [Dactylella cylindrospora]|nr:hypothetical protein ABW19_dt0200639 [Dactylella cylindrospora]
MAEKISGCTAASYKRTAWRIPDYQIAVDSTSLYDPASAQQIVGERIIAPA